MSDTRMLTPAQIEFVNSRVPGFSTRNWIIEPAGHAGSDRRFIRICDNDAPDESYILVIWDSHDADWNRFLTIHADLEHQTSVLPKIYAKDERLGLILEEDLGAQTLKTWCESCSGSVMKTMYGRVCESLAQWHKVNITGCAPINSRSMDEPMFLWETAYFAEHCVVEFFGLPELLGSEWERERIIIARQAAALPQVCMHRDFQSENIMITPAGIRYVDYQGARLGPAAYDLGSLLYDPYIESLPLDAIPDFLKAYQNAGGATIDTDSFRIASIQRLMQALGAYGNLSIHKGKNWYTEYIPRALYRLLKVLEEKNDLPISRKIVKSCISAMPVPSRASGT